MITEYFSLLFQFYLSLMKHNLVLNTSNRVIFRAKAVTTALWVKTNILHKVKLILASWQQKPNLTLMMMIMQEIDLRSPNPSLSIIRSSFYSGCFLDLLSRREGYISLTEGSKKLQQQKRQKNKKSTTSDEWAVRLAGREWKDTDTRSHLLVRLNKRMSINN